MTALGARKHDATGRSTGQRKTNKRTRIEGQFRPRLVEMLESYAFRVLNQSEHRVLFRLEIELAHHGGADNGRLPCMFDDFEHYGVHRRCIAPAIRALEALGFIEITQPGRAGNGMWRRPHLFRLTYEHSETAKPTHEWRRIDTIEQANAIASEARKNKSPVAVSAAYQWQKVHHNGKITSGKKYTTGLSVHSATTIDISGATASRHAQQQGRSRSAPTGSAEASDRPAKVKNKSVDHDISALRFAFEGEPTLTALLDGLPNDIIKKAARLLDIRGPQSAADWLCKHKETAA